MGVWNPLQLNNPPRQAVKSDGSLPKPTEAGQTLASSSTYYYDLMGNDAPLSSVHALWDASIVITSMEIEDTNCPEVALASTTAGQWITEDPSDAYVAVEGAGVTATNATVAATGGAIGGAMWHLGNDGALKKRLKVVVGATGGVMRVQTHYKSRQASGR